MPKYDLSESVDYNPSQDLQLASIRFEEGDIDGAIDRCFNALRNLYLRKECGSV